VLEENDGLPRQVLNLGSLEPDLCVGAAVVDTPPALIAKALEVAEGIGAEDIQRGSVEFIVQSALTTRVLAPVSISRRQLEVRERVIIGVGYNYAEHAREVGADAETLLVFPKFTEPTGPYRPVKTGRKLGDEQARPVRLLDYEAELGLVLLVDIDLSAPLPDEDAFFETVAFFTANDVSNRRPIVLDTDYGFTRGKSQPGYLPTGPWLVHGRHLKSALAAQARDVLAIELNVLRPCDDCTPDLLKTRVAQRAATDQMLRRPWQILSAISQRYRNGEALCMRDADAVPRYVHDADGMLPAGSILLTGTPSGTAIRRPGLLQRIRLFLLAGFSVSGARALFVEETEARLAETHYLRPGDRVQTRISELGQQSWVVEAEISDLRVGVDSPGQCE
jgi:2-keto-4-pentenoate hydratase/2-oxohepta-3-ene-1,7-dioic acid hydratase in catechol pathway